jgi:hypothetical protein
MPTLYSYRRLSTRPQAKDGGGFERQLDATKFFIKCHPKLNLTLDDSLRHIGSAYHGDQRAKGALGEFLKKVGGEVKKGSYLSFESFDRWSREPDYEAIIPFIELIKAGIKVVLVQRQLIYDEHRLKEEGIGGIVNEMRQAYLYSKLLGYRIAESWAQKRAIAGTKPMTKMCVGWLELKGDQYVEKEDRANAVRELFDLIERGRGLKTACDELNARGMPSTGGGEWTVQLAQRVIWNDAVRGTFQPKKRKGKESVPDGSPIPGYYPDLFAKDLDKVDRVREIVRKRRNGAGAGRKGALTNLFTHVAKCTDCDSPMRVKLHGAGKPGYLKCGRTLDGRDCANHGSWPYSQIEAAVIRHIKELPLERLERARVEEMARLREVVSAAKERAAQNAKAMENLLDKMELGDNVADRYKKRQREAIALSDELARAEEALGRAQRMSSTEDVNAVKRLEARLESERGQDLRRLRMELAQVIKNVIDGIDFSGQGKPLIWLKGEKGRLSPTFYLIDGDRVVDHTKLRIRFLKPGGSAEEKLRAGRRR